MPAEESSLVPWGRVQHTAERVAVVGSGPSAKGLEAIEFPECVTVIAVNGAVDRLPRADLFFTLDPSPANRRRMREQRPARVTAEDIAFVLAREAEARAEERKCAVQAAWRQLAVRYRDDPRTIYCCATFGYYGTKNYPGPIEGDVIWLRRVHGSAGARGFPGSLSDDPASIAVGNSGFGALGLAYLMQPRRVGLFGIDGDEFAGYAWDQGTPGSLRHVPSFFERAVPQLEARGIDVVTASLTSRVRCFPQLPVDRAIAWLAS